MCYVLLPSIIGGGLITSTLSTLVTVPAVFLVFDDIERYVVRFRGAVRMMRSRSCDTAIAVGAYTATA